MKQYPQPNIDQLKNAHLIALADKYQVAPWRVAFAEEGVKLKNIAVLIHPDNGRHYLTPLFDEEEVLISLNKSVIKTDKQEIDVAQLNVDFGNFALFTRSDFSTGATISIKNEVLNYNGVLFYWDGKIPKSVPKGSTPETSGGIGKGNWIPVSGFAFKDDALLLRGRTSQDVVGDLYADTVISGRPKQNRTWLQVDQKDGSVGWHGNVDGGFIGIVSHPKKSGIMALLSDLTSNAIFSSQTKLSRNTNLNDVINDGIYIQEATSSTSTSLNYPIESAGTLLVFKNNINKLGVSQIYICHDGKGIYWRVYQGFLDIGWGTGKWNRINDSGHESDLIFGIDQKWSNVTSQRVSGTEYTNDTEKPILVIVSTKLTENNASASLYVKVDGVSILDQRIQGTSLSLSGTFIVQPKSKYVVNAYNHQTKSISQWSELR